VIQTIHQKWNNVERSTLKSKELLSNISYLLKSEVDSIMCWLKSHVSDHSAAHYGGEVLRLWLQLKMGDENEWKLIELEKIMNSTRDLIELSPSHEVIWIWRRICCEIFLNIFTRPRKNPCGITLFGSSNSMNNFIKLEIIDVLEYWTATFPRKEISGFNLKEDELCIQFALKFIVWILRKISLYGFTDLIDKSLGLHNLNTKIIFEVAKSKCIPSDIINLALKYP